MDKKQNILKRLTVELFIFLNGLCFKSWKNTVEKYQATFHQIHVLSGHVN